MNDIVPIIITFLLTGIVGNKLLQEWQHRTWLHQQRLMGQEKEYLALKELNEEIAKAAGARLYQMRRLLSAIKYLAFTDLTARLKEHDAAVIKWNENLNFYYVRLTYYADYYDATSLERDIQEPFVKSGSEIMTLLRRRQA